MSLLQIDLGFSDEDGFIAFVNTTQVGFSVSEDNPNSNMEYRLDVFISLKHKICRSASKVRLHWTCDSRSILTGGCKRFSQAHKANG